MPPRHEAVWWAGCWGRSDTVTDTGDTVIRPRDRLRISSRLASGHGFHLADENIAGSIAESHQDGPSSALLADGKDVDISAGVSWRRAGDVRRPGYRTNATFRAGLLSVALDCPFRPATCTSMRWVRL